MRQKSVEQFYIQVLLGGKCVEQLFKKYAKQHPDNGRVFDAKKPRRQQKKMQAMRTRLCIIPGGLTRFLQPLDAGIKNLVKAAMRKIYSKFSNKEEKAHNLNELQNRTIEWIHQIWNISDTIASGEIMNYFNKSYKEVISKEIKNEEVKEEEKDALIPAYDPNENMQDLLPDEEGPESDSSLFSGSQNLTASNLTEEIIGNHPSRSKKWFTRIQASQKNRK